MGGITPFALAELLGLGTWELRGALDMKLEVTAAHVEALLRDRLNEGAHIAPLPISPDQ
jgi:hypothetical protein